MPIVSLILILVFSTFIPSSDDTAAIAFAEKAAPRALDYEQGNRATLVDAQNDFTLEGWAEFMKWLEGFVDDKGAPTGSSVFTATGGPLVKGSENGVTRLSIPGTLKQQARNPYGGISTTTYRVEVEVRVGGSPLKIQHLRAITCGAAPCR